VLGGIGLLFHEITTSAAAGLLILVMLALYNHYRINHPLKTFVPAIVLGRH
jgi:uncharacterized membrane protein YqjE